ncbi:MAG: histidine phosphatase family protein [Clostridia bacterium]|nr:histidine phosphatase family protein [Clostridia bacterium]
MKVIIIRHGDPDYSIDSLTEKGWKEAELLADRICKLDVKQFYCSPLGRAKDTASATLKRLGRTAEEKDWLREFHAPVIDPKSGNSRLPWDLMPAYWTEIDELFNKDKWYDTELMKSGDVKNEYMRVAKGIDDILAAHGYIRNGNRYTTEQGNHDTIVLFCHLGVEFVMLSHILGLSPSVLWQHFFVAPTSVTTLITEEREKGEVAFRCQSVGDTSHLYVADEPIAFSGRFCETFEDDTRH